MKWISKSIVCNLILTATFLGAGQPNIVLLFVDDLGWLDVGYRSPDRVETPNINRLAAQGTDFQQAYIASPCCSPSRATLLTGKHPARLKMVRHTADNPKVATPIYDAQGRISHHMWKTDPAKFPSRNWVDHEHISYAEALREQGYYNLFIGKWHIGHEEHHPTTQGFDRQIGTTNQGAPSNYYPDYFKTSDELADGKEAYLTDRLTDEAVQFISDYDREQPFMLSFWYYNVHKPHIGPTDYVKHFLSKGLSREQAKYSAMIKSVDDSVGRVRQALEDKGIADDTIVIFTSDQGSFFETPPYQGGKRVKTLYEGGARVPFIFHWPGVTKDGAINDSVIQTTDLFPTLVEIAGGDTDAYPDLDGVSLLGTIRKNSELKRGTPVYGYRAYEDLYVSVREGDWKLMAYRSGLIELFKVTEDRVEAKELAAVHPEKVERLKRKLIAWEKEMGVDQYSGVQ